MKYVLLEPDHIDGEFSSRTPTHLHALVFSHEDLESLDKQHMIQRIGEHHVWETHQFIQWLYDVQGGKAELRSYLRHHRIEFERKETAMMFKLAFS